MGYYFFIKQFALYAAASWGGGVLLVMLFSQSVLNGHLLMFSMGYLYEAFSGFRLGKKIGVGSIKSIEEVRKNQKPLDEISDKTYGARLASAVTEKIHQMLNERLY